MFHSKQKPLKPKTMERNVIAKNTSITGEIISEGDFRVDGSLEGTLKTNGKVIIGVDGLVKGKVESANADIDLALSDPDLKLSGKFTNMNITDPDFNATITTLGRKLGINHTPGHSHPGNYQSARSSFFGPQMFTSVQMAISGSTPHPTCPAVVSQNHTCDLQPSFEQSPDWNGGRTLLAYFGDNQHEHTLPEADQFYDFTNDVGKDYWSQVPATDWHDGSPTRNSPQASSFDCQFYTTNAFTNNLYQSICILFC